MAASSRSSTPTAKQTAAAERIEGFAAEQRRLKAAAADRIVGMLRRYPVVTVLAVGAVALIGPRRLFDYGTRAVTLYMLLRR